MQGVHIKFRSIHIRKATGIVMNVMSNKVAVSYAMRLITAPPTDTLQSYHLENDGRYEEICDYYEVLERLRFSLKKMSYMKKKKKSRTTEN